MNIMNIMRQSCIYFGNCISQGGGNHTKIGKTGALHNRKGSLNTSYSMEGINFGYLILCESENQMDEMEGYLHSYFSEYSTTQFPEHSGGFEWFLKRFTKDEIKEALENDNYENNIVDDPDEINKALEEYKKIYETEKKEYIEKMNKIKMEIEKRENPYIPRDFQNDILDESYEYYEKYDIGIIIMPCGTGKTVIGTYVGKKLNSEKILIGIPGNLLIPQWEKIIQCILPRHKIMCVTSLLDKSIDSDSLYTTDEKQINDFILNNHKHIIITTYHSCSKLKPYNFDFKIGDECHHLVGENKSKDGYKCFHKINSIKTLFLTATKKNVESQENDEEIYSMNNDKYFGNIIYEKNLRWAIDKGLVTDYNLIALKNNEEEILDIMRKCKIDSGNVELFLSAYMSLKSLTTYDKLSHILIYSNNTVNSDKIIEYIDILLKSDIMTIDTSSLYYRSLHSNTKCNIKCEIETFEKSSIGIISCVFIFGEGFDLPKLNGVVFAENMESEIRIIQSTSRCFRLNKEEPNKIGHVIIPYLDKEDWYDDNESFKKLRRIVSQLRNEDKNIEQNIKIKVHTVSKIKDHSLNNIFQKWKGLTLGKENYDTDCFIDDEDDHNLNKLKLRLRKSNSLKSRYESELHEYYEYLKERNRELNISSKFEYNNSKDEQDYVDEPDEHFELAWINWYDFFGYDTSKFIQSKEEWTIECKKNNIQSYDPDYKDLCDNNECFPKQPGDFYRGFTTVENELQLNIRRR